MQAGARTTRHCRAYRAAVERLISFLIAPLRSAQRIERFVEYDVTYRYLSRLDFDVQDTQPVMTKFRAL